MKVLLITIAIAVSVIFISTAAAQDPVLPSPVPIPTVAPASHDIVVWAQGWHRAAGRRLDTLNKARTCFNMKILRTSLHAPKRAEGNDVWSAAGRAWRDAARSYQHRTSLLRYRMVHPHGGGWEKWRPLVRWYWPAALVNTAISIMHYESSGNPRVLNGGYVLPASAGRGKLTYRAGGLFQLLPAPDGWADPAYNVWYAYHKKYLPAHGWSPWAGCRAFQ